MALVYEIVSDGKTVWVNNHTGAIARFSRFGIDIHLDGRCEGGYCTHDRPTLADWETFRTKTQEIHGIRIPDMHLPDFLCQSPV